jgi:hypothetical protein
MSQKRACTLALIVGLTGCGGGGGGGLAPEDLGEAMADAFCTRLVRCGLVASTAACEALLDVDNEELLAAIEAGTIDYDGVAARECLDAFAAASCDQSSESVRVEPPACAEAIRGTVADGGVCHASAECISQDCTVPDCGMACCAGTCATTTPDAAIGGSCATASCVDGAYCDAAMVCRALLAANATCTGNDECGYGLYCEQTGPSGVCRDAPNRGDACPTGDCADLGDRCDQATMICVALSAAGGPCGTSGGGCQFGLVCDAATMSCASPPAIGQPCQFQCADGAYCDAGTCAAVKPDGQMCVGDDECVSDYCDPFATPSVCAAEPICI